MKTILFLACLFGSIYVCAGWGAEGHKMITQIAQDLLTPTAQSVVTQFIGSNTLADIAPLPDDYDHTPQGAWSAPCHYVNMPQGATHFTMADCPGFCVVKSIMNYTGILQKTQANPTPCNLNTSVEPCALEFLVHYVGDVHQPLHVGWGIDEGGNEIAVTYYGTETNLHHVWDTSMIVQWNSDWTSGTATLEAIMQNETALVEKYESDTSPIDWADESFQYVLSTCYNYSNTTADDILMRKYKGLLGRQEPALGQGYYNRNIPIVEQRLIAAGVRLAVLLNTILVG